MHRFFIDENNFDGEKFIIDNKDDVKHISKVLRINIGEKVEICIQKSQQEWIAEVCEINTDRVILKSITKNEVNRESDIDITLYQGLPKSDKMDYIVQKATELGVKEIVPVEMDRCVAKLKPKDVDKKISRWQKIANEASKQSKRQRIPNVAMPIKLDKLNLDKHDLIILLYENEQNNSLKDILTDTNVKSVGVIVGTEGGLTEDEVCYLIKNGAKSVTLGNRILRTETAGIACVSIIQFVLGDI